LHAERKRQEQVKLATRRAVEEASDRRQGNKRSIEDAARRFRDRRPYDRATAPTTALIARVASETALSPSYVKKILGQLGIK
jgi:hypothetical protein